ncbi:MAG: T9SS type A sorting domain-containing protein [Saprospiraceae bacterium]|nr:T9SS type A sorting domain-containing protein [Saprospiraceae bacterium]
MMRRFFLPILFLLGLLPAGRAQSWIRSSDPPGPGYRVNDLLPDSLGNVYVLSDFFSQVSKFNAAGDLLWSRQLPEPEGDAQLAWSDFGNVLAMIETPEGLRLIELDPDDGQTVFSPSFYPFDLAGWAKTNSGVLMARSVGSKELLFRRLDATGGIDFEKWVDIGIRTLSTNTNIANMLALPDGGAAFRVPAVDTFNGHPLIGFALVRVDAEANLLSARHLLSLRYDANWESALLPNQGLVFAREWKDTVEILRYDANDQLVWRRKIKHDAYIAVGGVVGTPDGGLLVAGTARLPQPHWFAIPRQLVLFKLDAAGELQWRRYIHLDPFAYTEGEAITLMADGSWLAAGWTADSLGASNKRLLLAKGGFSTTTLQGKVLRDENNNCLPDSGELPLEHFFVRASRAQAVAYAVVDSQGNYEMPLDTGIYTVEVVPPAAYWEACDVAQVDLSQNGASDTLDFSMAAAVLCPLPEVNISSMGLPLCLESQMAIQYCNRGTAVADPAILQLLLPAELDLVSADAPPLAQSGDTLWFNLGQIGINECGTFRLTVLTDCDSAVMGQTLCTEARILPDSLCVVPPGWNGANVVVNAECVGDSLVQFRIQNTGSAANSTNRNYIVIEDQIVLMNGQFNLQPNSSILVPQPANGHFIRLEAQQEPNHPFPAPVVAWAEGCGGSGTPGMLNQYFLGDDAPGLDIDCQQVVASYDPNDKQGVPTGVGDEHAIGRQTELNYRIRFQNTGTDTARGVLLRDTLSPWLDPATLRVGAASHPFVWQLESGGVLSFLFDNIYLPDSNHNEPASHGFIHYLIRPKTSTPLGTRIENRAAIYFDFNPPVMTNTTFHTVDSAFLTVLVEESFSPMLRVSVQPNPVAQQAVFQLTDPPAGPLRVYLTDSGGRLLRQAVFSGKRWVFERQDLPEGIYFFRIETAAGLRLGSGKIIAGSGTP